MAETGGVNLLLDLLPIPYVDPVVAAAEAAAAAAALESEASAIMSSTMSSTMSRSGRLASIKSLAGSSKSIKGVRDTPRIPSPVEVIDYSTKPGSPSVQKALLHVLAAVLQNVEARTALLALDAAVGKVHKPEIVPMLVNLLATETPEIAEAAVAQTPTAGTTLWLLLDCLEGSGTPCTPAGLLPSVTHRQAAEMIAVHFDLSLCHVPQLVAHGKSWQELSGRQQSSMSKLMLQSCCKYCTPMQFSHVKAAMQ